MPRAEQRKLPPGHQPYDTLNGARVGALAGVFIGALVAALIGFAWPLIVGVVGGGAIGYTYQRAREAEAIGGADHDERDEA